MMIMIICVVSCKLKEMISLLVGMRHYTRLLDANRENKELRSGSLHDVKRQEAKMNGDNHFVISEKMWI